jgi:hypothetical protein
MEKSKKDITLTIGGHKTQLTGKSLVIFYQIMLSNNKHRWEVRKRYNEFRELHKQLKSVIGFLPSFPSKTLFKVKNEEQIQNRKMKLEVYLKLLLDRVDVFAYPYFIEFLEV